MVMKTSWEPVVQGSIPGLGKLLAPGLALISHIMMSILVREIFRLIITMKNNQKMLKIK